MFNSVLLNALAQTYWRPKEQSEEDRTAQLSATVTAMQAFKAADEIEAMLAAQAIGLHHASMECSRRAMIPDQPFEVAQGHRKAAANASRTFTELLSALDRKRGKGSQQKVTVEHVHVHAGGRAIVGNVASGEGGGGGRDRGQSNGGPQVIDQLANESAAGAGLPSMRSQDEEREPVPATDDAERPMSHARWPKHRPPHGRGHRAHSQGSHKARPSIG